MPQIIPLIPSEPSYRLTTVIAGITCKFDVRWNASEGAWYFDLFDESGIRLVSGVKIVLGTYLARRLEHPLTREGVFMAADSSGEGREATFDDLGTRVLLGHFTTFEMVSEFKAAADEVLDARG